MEEKPPSNVSKPLSLAEIDFSTGDGPQPHTTRFLDPREVEKHFAPLLNNRSSPEQRWAKNPGLTCSLVSSSGANVCYLGPEWQTRMQPE